MKLIIYTRDGCSQVINLSPQFNHTEVKGHGQHKKVITPQVRAEQVARDIAGNLYLRHSLENEK